MFKINFLQLFRVNLIKQDVEIFSARSQCNKTKKKKKILFVTSKILSYLL